MPTAGRLFCKESLAAQGFPPPPHMPLAAVESLRYAVPESPKVYRQPRHAAIIAAAVDMEFTQISAECAFSYSPL